MRKVILMVCLAIFVLPTLFALDLNVQNNSTNVAMIQDINQPATFNLLITNYGPSDNLQFYNLLGFTMAPVGNVPIGEGQTISVPLLVYPRDNMNYNGYYIFNYFIQGQDGSQLPESLTLKVMNLKDAFTVGASEINPQSDSVTIYIKNNANFNFQNINVQFNSPFFSMSKQFSLAPYQEQDFQVTLNRDDFKSLLAGFYTLSANVNANGKLTTVNGNIDFSEKNILNVSNNNYGFLINTNVIQKTNEGNAVASSQTIVTKNIISRLFTTFNPQPDIVDREGLLVYYTWENQIQPGEILTITTTTNWLLPFFIVVFIIAIIILVRVYTRTALSLDKKVIFLKAKGGEFALKVNVTVTAKKYVNRVTVVERLPPIAKLYEKFGAEKPSRIDETNKRLEWHFNSLEPGETRVLSYIIYSKVGVLGRFALPVSRAMYERDGKAYESESNKAFLITEQGQIKEE